MKYLLAVSLAVGLTGCATLDPGTPILSEKLGESLEQSSKDKMSLIDLFSEQSTKRVNEFIKYRFGPDTVKDFLADGEFKKLFCKEKGKHDQALLILELIEDLYIPIEEERNARHSKKRKIVRQMRRRNRKRSDWEITINSELTKHLRTVGDDASARKAIFEAAKDKVPFADDIEAAILKIDELTK